MKLRVVIVDDEPLARERVRALLASESDVVVVAECGSGAEAVEILRSEKPDLVLLDIQMPEMNGFQVLEALGAALPAVIFVTAFDQYAVKAFEVHALDYLLKPFKPARFKAALAHARQQLAAGGMPQLAQRIEALLAERAAAEPPHLTRLAVRQGERVSFIKTADIDWIEASGNYVVLHAGTSRPTVRETLGSLEAKLSPKQFFRASRSALINLERVVEVQPLAADEHVVILRGGARIPLTRGVRELQDRLRFA
jgi:two-component system LytT family response regulator